MNSKDVLKEKNKLLRDNIKLELEIKKNAEKIKELQSECNHEIILKFCDHKPHKIGVIYECVCPFCGKEEDIYPSYELDKSSFSNSKVIDLSKYSISSILNNFTNIVSLVTDNYESIVNNEYDYDLLKDNLEIDNSIKKIKSYKKNIKLDE